MYLVKHQRERDEPAYTEVFEDYPGELMDEAQRYYEANGSWPETLFMIDSLTEEMVEVEAPKNDKKR